MIQVQHPQVAIKRCLMDFGTTAIDLITCSHPTSMCWSRDEHDPFKKQTTTPISQVIFDAAVGTTHPLLNLVVPWHLEHLELKPIITRGFKQSAAKLFPQLRPAPSTQDHSRSLKHPGSWNRMESLHSESSMPRQQRQCFHESHFP